MKIIHKTILASSAIILLNSCVLFFKETTTATVAKTYFSKRSYMLVKTLYHGHCGCTDVYAQQFINGMKVYELYPACSKYFTPQKIIYSYDAEGALVNKSYYSISSDSHFTIAPDETDSIAIAAINKYSADHLQHNAAACNKPITGFNPKTGE